MWRMIWVLVFLFFGISVYAQNDQPPLFALIDGDIYSYSGGSLFRETNWGHNHAPIVSPDGRYIAYGSLPELLVELDAKDQYLIDYDQHPPTNIWVMEIATKQFTRITQQPEQAGDEPRFSRRSNPVWSPDSQQIAWLEANFHDNEDGLVLNVYTMATGEIQRGIGGLAGVAGDAGFWTMPNDLYWGAAIAYDGWTFQMPAGFEYMDYGSVLFVLNQNAILQERIAHVAAGVSEINILNWRWVMYQGEWFIALQYSYGWRLWNTRTNELFILEKPPFAETLNGVRVDFVDDESGGLTLVFEDGRRFTLPKDYQYYAIAPDGDAVAYIEQNRENQRVVGRLMLWENDAVSQLWPVEFESWLSGLAWSPLSWHVEGSPILLPNPTPFPIPTPNRG